MENGKTVMRNVVSPKSLCPKVSDNGYTIPNSSNIRRYIAAFSGNGFG